MTIALSVLFGLLSMLTYGLANAYSKPLSQKLGPAQLLFVRGLGISLILAVLSIPTYHYASHWPVVLGAIALGIAGYLPVLAFTHAVRESPLGIVAPIAGASPLLTVMLSFVFLNVHLHKIQWLAIAIVVLANIVVSVDVRNLRQSRLLHKTSGIPLALVAATGWGLFYFFLVPITKVISPWLAAFLVELGVTIAAGMHLRLTRKEVSLKKAWSQQIILNDVFIGGSTLAFTVGVRYFNVGIVAALSNSTALITVVLGVILFHERLQRKERVAGFIMIVGVALLSAF